MKFAELKSQIDDQNSGYGDSKLNKVKNLEAILDVVKSINSTLIMDNVLEVVLKNAIKISETERGFIVLKNSEDKLGISGSLGRLTFFVSSFLEKNPIYFTFKYILEDIL